MTNFDIARKTLDTALNGSEGSAEKELSNYQQGIEYSLDKLQANFQDFSRSPVAEIEKCVQNRKKITKKL